MSAIIPSDKQLDDLLKPTGFDCPEDLKGKTFAEATSGGGGAKNFYGWKRGSTFLFASLGMPVVGDKIFNLMPTSQVNTIVVTEVTSEDEIVCGSATLTRAPAYDFEL